MTNPKLDELTEEEVLKSFQQKSGLKETGRFDDATLSKMDEPRCGNTDFQSPVKVHG